MHERTDVVVVGGGIAGLAAATIVARGGAKVVLVERTHAVGGRAATHVVDGHSFNLGPHALYVGGHAESVLRAIGVKFSGNLPKTSGAKALFEGRVHALPTGASSLLSTSLLSFGEKIETAKLLSALPKSDPAAIDGLTVRDWIDRSARSPRVRALLEAVVRVSTYANAPELQSAGRAVRQIQTAMKTNVRYLDGGWQTLVDGLRAAAMGAGVSIVEGARVQRVDVTDGGSNVVLEGRTLVARGVILAVAPSVARALVPTSKSLARFDDDAVPIHAACLDLALSALPRPKSLFALGIDAPLYVSVHSAYAHLAPEKQVVLQLARYRPTDDAMSAEAIERQLEEALDRLQPGWRDVVVHRRFLPKLVVANAVVRADRARPDVEVPDARGVFVCGDWVGAEGMLADAALASAARAAESLLHADALSRAGRDPTNAPQVAHA